MTVLARLRLTVGENMLSPILAVVDPHRRTVPLDQNILPSNCDRKIMYPLISIHRIGTRAGSRDSVLIFKLTLIREHLTYYWAYCGVFCRVATHLISFSWFLNISYTSDEYAGMSCGPDSFFTLASFSIPSRMMCGMG